MTGYIKFSCDNCGKKMSAPASSAGKSGKCKSCNSTITVPLTTAEVVNPPPIPSRSNSTGIFGSVMGLFAGESPEDKAARVAAIAAKEEATRVADDARKASWKRFWFQMKVACGCVFFSFVGLIAWGVYLTKDAPRITYQSAPPSNFQPAPQPTPAAPVQSVANTPHTTPSTPLLGYRDEKGVWHEGKFEQIKENITGKETVHRKDGTTYQRSKAKK